MRKWIEFNIKHPKIVLLLLVIITLISIMGLKRLHFDGSTDALLPKNEIIYKLGQRAKKVFGDSKTFLIAAIEPAETKLFTYEVFSYLNNIVEEIEEFKDFNYELENQRLTSLLELGNITIVSNENIQESNINKETKSDSLEQELDEEIFEDNIKSPGDKIKNQTIKETKTNDIWDLSKPLKDVYLKPLRERNKYNYKNYTPLTINQIKSKLDKVGLRQLNTILLHNKIKKNNDEKLTIKEFTKILENYETLYLYKSMEIVKTFINPISGEDILGTEEELRPVDLVETDDSGKRLLPKTEKDFKEYKKILLGNPAYEASLYSRDEDGNFQALAFNIVLRPQRNHFVIFDYLFTLFEKYNHKPVKFTMAGIPLFQTYIIKYMQRDMKKLMPLVILVVILIFYLNFRLVRGVVLPIITVVLGMLWTMGLMGYAGIPITIIVNILPTLLIAVASSDSIHIFNQYLHDQKMIHNEGKKTGLVISMNHISLTVLLTSLTTFIGFSTLSTNQVMSLKHFGIFAAIGTVVAMAVTVMLIPSALMLMKLLPLKNKKNNQLVDTAHTNIIVQKIINIFSSLSLKHYKLLVSTMFVLIVIFSFGVTKINVETAPLFNFKEDSYIYKADMKMSALFRGTIPLNLVIDSGKTNGIKDPEFLNFIEEIREWLTSEEGKEKFHHLKTYAFTDIVKRMHKAMNNDNPDYYKIPDNKTTIQDYLEIYSGEDRDSDGRIDSFEQFVDVDYREANIVLRTGNYNGKLFTSNITTAGVERIRNYMKSHPLAKKYKWHMVGEPLNFFILAKRILEGQILTVIVTLIIIAIIMLLLFKNWKASLVSIIPITTSIIIVYGLMGYLGIPLDIAKCLLAALTIGIGVDDTIHMLKTLRHNLSQGMNMQAAIAATHKEAGMAIVYTSLAIICGFSVFMFSEFKPVFYLGWLVAFTMLSTTISALVLLPAVINFLKIDLQKESKNKIFKWFDLNKLFNVEK